jgi:hypothetical protein
VIPNTVSLVPGCVARLKHTPPWVLFSSYLSMFAPSGMPVIYCAAQPLVYFLPPHGLTVCVARPKRCNGDLPLRARLGQSGKGGLVNWLL